MRKILQKLDLFHVIFLFFGIFFSFVLFFSIPSLFDYKKLESKVEDKIESDYNLIISDLKDIKYRFVPSPHLIIGDAKLRLNRNKSSQIAKLSDAKVFISILKLYDQRKILIKKIHIKNDNFNLETQKFNLLIEHLYNKNTKKLIIEKSKVFFSNKKDEVSTISPIKKLEYKINNQAKQKNLSIVGNIFDTKYVFKWTQDLSDPSVSDFNLKFKNPNIFIQNNLNTNFDSLYKKGILKTKFLSENIDIIYLYNQNEIIIKKDKNKNNILVFGGKINLNPFYFNISTDVKKQKISDLTKFILPNFFNNKDSIHQNLNGDLTFNFQNIQNAFINSGNINFNFSESQIVLSKNKFNIRNIGTFKIKKNLFYENKNGITFAGLLEVKVNNPNEFYRRFAIPMKNRIKLEKIYIVIEKNLDSDDFFLSNLYINSDEEIDFKKINLRSSDKQFFDNFQKLRNIIKDEFIKLN